MKHLKIFLIFFNLNIFFTTNTLNAELIRPKQYGSEKRFKYWNYNPNGVYYFEGYNMHPSYIEFGDQEIINTVYSPKSEYWEFSPMQNRLFLKPINENADTTLTVMTNERVYFFELHAYQVQGPFDDNVTFFIKFRYPPQTKNSTAGSGDQNSIIQYVTQKIPDLSKTENMNFNYTVAGDYNITPIKIFDDGKFTYFEFRPNAILPAFFSVNSDGYESMINFRIVAQYLSVEGVFAIFTLRYGSSTVCVFNESLRGISANLPKMNVNNK